MLQVWRLMDEDRSDTISFFEFLRGMGELCRSGPSNTHVCVLVW